MKKIIQDFFYEVNQNCVNRFETKANFTNAEADFIQVITTYDENWNIEVIKNNTVITNLEFNCTAVLKDILIGTLEACGVTKRL